MYSSFALGYHDNRRMPSGILVHFLLLLSLLVPTVGSAATLDDITFTSLPGERVQIRLKVTGFAGDPLSFAIDEPARLALDFPATNVALGKKSQTIGVGMARSITAVEGGDRTRVVLNLIKLVPYEISRDGSDILLTLESGGSSQSRAFLTAESKAGSGAAYSLENVDFRRGENGEGRIIVTLSDPSIVIDSREEAGQVIVDFINTSLPAELERTLDVIDFATPVSVVDTFAQGDGVRLVIKPKADFEFLAYQSDDLFTAEIKPVTKEEAERLKKAKIGFTGERLSLNFQNIEVRAILQLLADFTGLNMVASDSVGGNLTLRLKNVPWDQALDIILKSRGLAMRKNGNVIMVAPSEELAAREKLELEAQQQIEELAPLNTEFVQVNYAKAADIATLLQASENSMLSERGSVSLDARTNTLLVRDTAANLASVRRLVNKLDVPVRQVLIESRIVIADDDFQKDIGVRFGVSRAVNSPGEAGSPAQNPVFDKPQQYIGGFLPGQTDFSGVGGPTSFNTDNVENYMVDLPNQLGTFGSLGLAVGKIGSWLLQLELQAMQLEGRGEIISNPRVITANQTEAMIEQGTEVPYQEASSSGSTSTAFKKAVLSLKVTPQITPDDRIIMDLEINKDAVGQQTFNGVPTVDTRNIKTQVLVENGETVVLGGVYEQTLQNETRRIPFFSELPVVGFLFKQHNHRDEKSELLVFVTPKILKDTLAVR